MSSRALVAVCIVVLLVAFAIDLVTPQLFVAAILLDIPIVLSTYAGNRRFTTGLVAAALVANIVAGYLNGLHAGGVWDAIGLGDRALAALSIILVGMLGLAVHSGAERSGGAIVLAEEARLERELRRAVQKIRGSLSEELVEREIVRQACLLVRAPKASFYLAAGAAGWTTRFDASADSPEVVEVAERPRAELQSILIRALETQEPVQVSQDDAMGRLVLDGLAARGALVVPLVDGDVRIGAVLVALDREAGPEDLRVLRLFAESAAIALGQARLFIELAAKNDELARRSNVIRDIVYALAHDLRTPLSAAGLTLRQARAGEYGSMPPAYLETLSRSIAANDELQRLAETLLLVAQYESGERSMVHHPVDVARLTREAVTQLESLAQSKSLKVVIDAPEEAIVSGDAGELRRALVNLFANAVQWSREDGTIRIKVERNDDDRLVRISISDEGFGVPAEIRNALFTRFGSEGRRGGGTGLGLYIVRRIVEEHGGRVKYAPNEPKGSTFTIELPELVARGAVPR